MTSQREHRDAMDREQEERYTSHHPRRNRSPRRHPIIVDHPRDGGPGLDRVGAFVADRLLPTFLANSDLPVKMVMNFGQLSLSDTDSSSSSSTISSSSDGRNPAGAASNCIIYNAPGCSMSLGDGAAVPPSPPPPSRLYSSRLNPPVYASERDYEYGYGYAYAPRKMRGPVNRGVRGGGGGRDSIFEGRCLACDRRAWIGSRGICYECIKFSLPSRRLSAVVGDDYARYERRDGWDAWDGLLDREGRRVREAYPPRARRYSEFMSESELGGFGDGVYYI
ncbi:hypothetical protein QBC47DRAFT_377502 [Echria macrotheca]|uniref:Uncharacterized protein n=1 Tax=Echria macrotheca TaxID=438768 RepID=A0AAJ0BGH6_9PEZI|nr:hypothetical protein QBC47DRAFT_377502 [Echria macrotheca]